MTGKPAGSRWRPALFASSFAPHVGGVEELVRQLAHEQIRRGDTPIVVTNRYPKSLPASQLCDGIPVHRYPFRVPEPNPRQFGGWLVHGRRTAGQLRRRLVEHGVDLIHVQCVSSNGRYALQAADALDLPLVVSLQGELTMDTNDVYGTSAELRRSWRRLLDRADIVSACAGYVLAEAEAALGESLGDKGVVVPNGVRLEDFTATPTAVRERAVLGIGRLVPQKGFDILLRAFAQVAPTEPDVRLLLAGDGPSRDDLERLAIELNIDGQVAFLGRVDHAAAVRLFQSVTAFVLPSRHEPQGIVVLEAMAAGTPVIAARVGGVPETVQHGVNGLLYDDPAELTEHLRTVLSDPSLARRLVAAGRTTAETRSWQAITTQYEACYRTATGAPESTAR